MSARFQQEGKVVVRQRRNSLPWQVTSQEAQVFVNHRRNAIRTIRLLSVKFLRKEIIISCKNELEGVEVEGIAPDLSKG